MHIAILNWKDIRHPQAGGAELYAHRQALIWRQRGHSVSWICARASGQKASDEIDGIQIHRVGGRFSVYLRMFAAFPRLTNVDVVIDVENGIPFFSPLFTRCPKVLVIHHVHREVWHKELPWLPAVIGRFLELKIMPWLYRGVPIVTVSESSREDVANIMPTNYISIVHNGVGDRLNPGTPSERPEIVYLGRLKKYKSVEVLLRAMVELKDEDLTLNIIGTGDDEESLRRLCEEFGLNSVKFHGFVTEDEKLNLLQRAWLAVNPSMVEGWSVTNIEANACGLPVIGSNVPGIRDSIVDDETGLLFEYGNVSELAAKIRGLVNNTSERERLGRNAYMWAKQFSWEASAESLLHILEDVAGGLGRTS